MKHLITFEGFDNEPSNIESKINVIDNIRRDDIEGYVPSDAKYAQLNPNHKFIQKFYRITNVKFNDGTNSDILQYWGERGGWHNSSYNSREAHLLAKNDFLEII